MSTFTGLNTMVRGIFNSQTALNTTGHNITNASTEGFSRQSVNSVATMAETRGGIYGAMAVGTGVDIQSITRSRDIFADKQFRKENSTQNYYETRAKAYDNLEVIFNDTGDTGFAQAVGAFYKSWVDLSANASDIDLRTVTINKAKILCDIMKTDTRELQNQINSTYNDISFHITDCNEIIDNIVNANKMIIAKEADGSMANDLRDARDLLVDDLSKYMNVTVTETEQGAYQIISDGIALVNGITKLTLVYSQGVSSKAYGVDYGLADHSIYIKESNQVFVPQNGILKAEYDAIAECKSYMDMMIDMACFMLTTFNDQHAEGYDYNGNEGGNFFGLTYKDYTYDYDARNNISYIATSEAADDLSSDTVLTSLNKLIKTNSDIDADTGVTKLTGVAIINAFDVAAEYFTGDGAKLIAAATQYAVKDSNGDFIQYTTKDDLDNNKLQWSLDVTSDTVVTSGTVSVGDGTNAVYISELFNLNRDTILQSKRSNALVVNSYEDIKDSAADFVGRDGRINPLSGICINNFYTEHMTELAVRANVMDNNIEQQETLMVQIRNWRDSASGVDWNEELTNMIKYQKAYSSCARCLTAMDECLDRLVNNTGAVGR